jgi:isocitrate dehydrogenase (NAD+)
MKKSDGLFLACARDVFAGSVVAYDERIIDAGCMKLVQDPSVFDVLLCENLYGDVVSDLCAGLVGGLGVTPGANIGDESAVFEAVHGSAPDIAGQDLANPLALLMSAVMMLNHLAERDREPLHRYTATRIRAASDATLRAGAKTRDVGGTLGTRAFADAIIERVLAS